MDPERKIEKLLRAYARKRRADAGDSFKLHPATRRLLQAEVARNQSRPDAEETDVSLWELFRRQWAVLAGFALLVFFGATLFLPALGKAKFKSQQLTAMNNPKQIGLAAQIAPEENHAKLPESLAALTNQLGSDKMLADAENGPRFSYVAAGDNPDAMPSNAVLAYSPTDKKGRAVLFADGRGEIVKGDRFAELTNRGLPQLVAANDFERQQPAAPPKAFDRLAKEQQNATGKDFVAQTSSGQLATAASPPLAFGLQNSFKNTIAPAKTVPVLANFQVQQNGNAIRVVDGDGSVYDGSLLPESAVAQTTSAPAATPPPIVTATAQIERAKTIARPDESQAVQNNFFRVSGMNQSLKQNVVFTGTLLATANAALNSPQSFSGSNASAGGGGSQAQSALTQPLSWANSRIAGTAIIADTNSIEINAVPLAP